MASLVKNAHCYSSTPFSGMVDRTFSCLFMLWGSYAVIQDTAGMKRQVYNISESIELSHACHMDSQACNHPVEHEWFKATTSTMVPTAGHCCTNLVSSPDPQLGSIHSACTEGLGTRLVLILFKTIRLKQPLVYNGQKNTGSMGDHYNRYSFWKY